MTNAIKTLENQLKVYQRFKEIYIPSIDEKNEAFSRIDEITNQTNDKINEFEKAIQLLQASMPEQQSDKDHLQKSEKILCSAIWYKEFSPVPSKFNIVGKQNVSNITDGVVVCGHRHYHCILTMLHLTGLSTNESDCGAHIQGFLTSKNRFVNRKEAGEIAYAARQTKQFCETLYSEDLW